MFNSPRRVPNRQDQIGLAVGDDSRHAGGVKTECMRIRYDTPGPNGRRDRTSQVLRQLKNFFSCAGALGAVAAVDVDQFCIYQHFCCLANLNRIGRGCGCHTVFFRGPDVDTRASSPFWLMMSSGMSTWVGPGRPDVAIRNAWRIISGIRDQ